MQWRRYFSLVSTCFQQSSTVSAPGISVKTCLPFSIAQQLMGVWASQLVTE